MNGEAIALDDEAARQVLLVQAIEAADAQGVLLSEVERAHIEQATLAQLRPAGGEVDPARFLAERARRVLAEVEKRRPRISALQDRAEWVGWLPWLLPAAACVAAVLVERIDNPHQVNMLSPPLLAVLFWNLGVYAALLLAPLWPRRRPAAGPAAWVQRRLAGVRDKARRTGRLEADIRADFRERWLRATWARQGHWFSRILHASAAGWGIGLVISLIVGGLVREYRVGWESTFLDASQVHAFLQVLFAPVAAIFSPDPFSVEDVRRMAFSAAGSGVAESRRWVWMYLGLLAAVVVVPRVALAAYHGWRAHRHSREVLIAAQEPYFARLLGRARPAHLRIAVAGADAAARDAALLVFRQAQREPPPARATQAAWTAVATAEGDRLEVVPADLARLVPSVPAAVSAKTRLAGWVRKAMGREVDTVAGAAGPADCDLLVLAVGAPFGLAPCAAAVQRWPGPVLLLTTGQAWLAQEKETAAQQLGRAPAALAVGALPVCWTQDTDLQAAIARLLPAGPSPGFERIVQAWNAAELARFDDDMHRMATAITAAASHWEALPDGRAMKRWMGMVNKDAGGRLAQEENAVKDSLLDDVHQCVRDQVQGMRARHGIDPSGLDEAVAAAAVATAVDDPFLVDAGSTQSHLAAAAQGAIAGAGTGVGVDVAMGGTTLGLAAAAGAVVGAGAALAANTRRREEAAADAAHVRLGDGLLQAMTASLLLGYVSTAQAGRYAGTYEWWRDAVHDAVAQARPVFAPLWAQARAHRGDSPPPASPLADALADAARLILGRVCGGAAGGAA